MLLMTLVVQHLSSGFARNVNCGIVTLVIGRKHIFLPPEFHLRFPKQNLICVMWSDMLFPIKDSESLFFQILNMRD